MKIVIIYYSKHHQNTKKLLDKIKETDSSLELLDVTKNPQVDLSSYDLIGFASGIYFNSFSKEIIKFIKNNSLENKNVFLVYTHGAPFGFFLHKIKKTLKKKKCQIVSRFHCRGYDTYVFKTFGGIAKGHPNEEDFKKAVCFYEELKSDKKVL